jgi:hypothetical protein
MTERLYTVTEPELAELFRVAPRTIRLWRASGMPHRLLDGAAYYEPALCIEWRRQQDRTEVLARVIQKKRIPARTWIGFFASAAIHAAVLWLALWAPRHPEKTEHQGPQIAEQSVTPVHRAPEVQMVYLPPPPAERNGARKEQPPPPAPKPEPPAPRVATGAHAPSPELPAEPKAISPATAPDAAPAQPTPGPQPSPQPAAPALASNSPAAAPEATLESEARRLFGLPSAPRHAGGPVQRQAGETQEWNPYWRRKGDCMPMPQNDSTGTAMVKGRVYREDSHTPLPGARLQIVGTPFGTFSDGSGYYKLVFDAALVANCRVQSVRVTAIGYRGEDLILAVSRTDVDSDILLAR